ncbi:hypothetical protein ACNKHO_04400 [Shigella flexneri]
MLLSPTSSGGAGRESSGNPELIDFSVKTTLPISIIAIIAMAITHFFWQRYLGQEKKRIISHEMLDGMRLPLPLPASTQSCRFTPIIGVLILKQMGSGAAYSLPFWLSAAAGSILSSPSVALILRTYLPVGSDL